MMRCAMIAIVLALSPLAPRATAQEDVSYPGFSIEAKYVGPNKVVIGATNSIPPSFIYRIEGFEYELTVTLRAPDRRRLRDSLYCIVCVLPDQSIRKIFLREHKPTSALAYEHLFSIPFRITSAGRYTFVLATVAETRVEMPPIRLGNYVARVDLDLNGAS